MGCTQIICTIAVVTKIYTFLSEIEPATLGTREAASYSLPLQTIVLRVPSHTIKPVMLPEAGCHIE